MLFTAEVPNLDWPLSFGWNVDDIGLEVRGKEGEIGLVARVLLGLRRGRGEVEPLLELPLPVLIGRKRACGGKGPLLAGELGGEGSNPVSPGGAAFGRLACRRSRVPKFFK